MQNAALCCLKKEVHMASINNFTIKNIVKFRGHDDEDCFQGNIYHDKTRVGSYQDNTWTGEADIDFTDSECKKVAEQASREYFATRPKELNGLEPTLDFFFHDVLKLIADEKEYLKIQKKGYARMIVYKEDPRHWKAMQIMWTKAELGDKWLAENPTKHIVKDFRSLADFTIGGGAK